MKEDGAKHCSLATKKRENNEKKLLWKKKKRESGGGNVSPLPKKPHGWWWKTSQGGASLTKMREVRYYIVSYLIKKYESSLIRIAHEPN